MSNPRAGYTAFEQVQDIFHIVSCNSVILKPQHLDHSQRHIFKGLVRQQTGVRDTSRWFQPKRYHWRGLDTCSWIAWGLSEPRGDLWVVNTSSHVRHDQCVVVTAIHEITSVEDDHLETDVLSANSGMDAIDRLVLLQGPLIKISQILVTYHVSFSRAAVRESSLAAVRTVRRRPAFTCIIGVNTSCHSKTLLQLPKHINLWMTTRITQHVLPCDSTSSTLAGDPSCVPCFFIMPIRALYRDKCQCWELWYPIWWWRISRKLNVSGYTLYNIL
jgi:hypothetical protein